VCFDTVGNALVGASDHAVGLVQRVRFSDATREIGADRAAIAARFGAAMRQRLHNPFAAAPTARTAETPPELCRWSTTTRSRKG